MEASNIHEPPDRRPPDRPRRCQGAAQARIARIAPGLRTFLSPQYPRRFCMPMLGKLQEFLDLSGVAYTHTVPSPGLHGPGSRLRRTRAAPGGRKVVVV